FQPEDVRDTKWTAIDRKLGGGSIQVDRTKEDCEWSDEDSGWKKTPVRISAPFHRRTQHPGPKEYVVEGFHHRSLVEVIREAVTDPTHHRLLHYEPYELRWQPPHKASDVRVYGELFTSSTFMTAHRQLQDSPPEFECDLPRRVIGLMFWSDSTHLTAFGTAKLWPLYLYIGNESKYMRCQPSSNLCSHAAYFQSLPDSFKDFAAANAGGNPPGDSFFTHCNRELFHAQWGILLDDEFIEAYQHGIVVQCYDGIKRRLYPRIFTYSADYPEKILIATIRNLGTCPCPRCLIPKSRIQHIATERDILQRKLLRRCDTKERREKVATARRLIYERQYTVDTAQVEALLKDESLVPTLNAFSERLHATGFDLFHMLVVDLLHEFELGVWKAVFIHLLRLLDASKQTMIHELDRRYRQVPTFGRDTIRRFRSNSSEMKRMAARDFEDLLLCAIPVFDKLLPEPHNASVKTLLFLLCHWHGLAKLRMHTDDTLTLMESVTIKLGEHLRMFTNETCAAFSTKELRREAEARTRREGREALLKRGSSSVAPPNQPSVAQAATRKPKTLNLQTYKLHALGDYTEQIRIFGTTDSYSTQPGELEHRVGKGRFSRTSRKVFIPQLASIERRQVRIRRIRAKLAALQAEPKEPVSIKPEDHHHIGRTQNFPEDLMLFVRKNSDDPLAKNFVLKLKAHFLPRVRAIHGVEMCADSSEPSILGVHHAETSNLDRMEHHDLSTLNQVVFKGDRIYRHNIFHVNYTTYDVRRAQDTINPRTEHRDIMLLAPLDSAHPFLYARVLGIFHANVIYTGPGLKDYHPRCLEVLWVRWFEVVDAPAGWEHAALDSLRFVPNAQDDAYGFINPADVLRGCHLIPAFADGRMHPDGVSMSRNAKDGADWKKYYVNRFVDRDMLLRYHWGHGVGHVYSHVPRAGTDRDGCVPTPSPFSTDPVHEGLEAVLGPNVQVDSSDQAKAPIAPDNWDDWDNPDSDDLDGPTAGETLSSDSEWDLGSNPDSDSDALMIASYNLESTHPGIDVLEYDDYRY
ncbi:hypothetical protein HYDPIDRAFT_90003, partial [Hydnomerulius pinastri MD-312]